MANKKAEEPEHISSSSSDSGSEDEQKGEGAQQEQKEGEGSPSRSRQSRNERKARKAILRLGMKPMPDIVKVVIRKAKQVRLRRNLPDLPLKSLSFFFFSRCSFLIRPKDSAKGFCGAVCQWQTPSRPHLAAGVSDCVAGEFKSPSVCNSPFGSFGVYI